MDIYKEFSVKMTGHKQHLKWMEEVEKDYVKHY